LNRWQISFPINGLHDVIKEPSSELTIDKVKFYYRENERVGSVIVDSDKQSDAEKEAAYQINKALAKTCFAYNTEASLGDGYYAIDLTRDPNTEWTYGKSIHKWSYISKDPNATLSKMESLSAEKQEVLDLALAYYKLGEYANPLRIESFFSCMTVIVRDLLNRNPNDDVYTSEIRNKIKDIFRQANSRFDESQFDQDWKSFYSAERCSISHGKGSKLIDVRTLAEHEKIVNTVGSWAREVIYYYIDKFKM
jgi:hypothetical protein